MNENTYYTPELSDIHPGMFVEYMSEGANWEQIWKPVEVVNYPIETATIEAYYNNKIHISDISTQRDIERIRVKYLDRDDIEAEGWINKKLHYSGGIFEMHENNKKISVLIMHKNHKFTIKYNPKSSPSTDRFFDNNCVFHGTILNKSELRFQMKRLGIKK